MDANEAPEPCAALAMTDKHAATTEAAEALVGPAAVIAPDTVARLVLDPATREATLCALEENQGTHSLPLALAVAPALVDLQCEATASEEELHTMFRRTGLLLARLAIEAADPAAMYGAAFGGQRIVNHLTEPGFFRRLREKSAAEIDQCDALSWVCGGQEAMLAPAAVTGFSSAFRATSGTMKKYFNQLLDLHPIYSR